MIYIYTLGCGDITFTIQADNQEDSFIKICNYINRRVENDKYEDGGFDSEHWISERWCELFLSGKFKVEVLEVGVVKVGYS